MSFQKQRTERLSRFMKEHHLNVLYIRSTSNIAWITGFEKVFDTESAHAFMTDGGDFTVHSDSRYSEALEREAADTPIRIDAQRRSHAKVLFQMIDGLLDAKRSDFEGEGLAVGIEDSISIAELRVLEQERDDWAQGHSMDPSAVRFVELTGAIEGLRECKDPSEIETMKKAQAITDRAFARLLDFIEPGMTERRVQMQLDRYMLEEGAEGLAFDTIVATGAHGSSPHAIPGDTRLSIGDAVVMDFGAKYGGYCSDMTRTVFIGEPSDELKHAWQTLCTVNETCERAIKAGVKACEVHELAESLLAEAGYQGKMGHSLGHSVGMDIHEAPTLSPSNQRALAVGNVVTVEPGIYIPGKFGMRLEDFGVVTESGFEVFTKSSHKMFIISKII